ncbi:MAG: molybdopterin converting factor subunit 1 [Proteobacteria bacterium]|nr:molybdopterin converting factor subunit 1 [Pseudomonadota bacterium]
MHIRYFAWLREIIGVGSEEVTMDSTGANPTPSVMDLVAQLRTTSPAHAKAFTDLTKIRVAVNHEYADLTHPLKTGDEVAFFPPVTGG